jgi:quercetin dioxygenase-like cupin family protein
MGAPEKVDLQLDSGPDKGPVYGTDPIQIMRIRLEPGDALPFHKANSNVLLMPLSGTLQFEEESGETHTVEYGEALSVEFMTPMLVSNGGDDLLTFLVLKTPHPKVMGDEG